MNFEADLFTPSAARVERLNRTIVERLVASLRYLEEFCRGNGVELPGLDEAWERLKSQDIPPATISAYFDLVRTVEAKSWKAVPALFEEIAACVPRNDGEAIKVRAIGDPQSILWSERYERYLNAEEDEDDPIGLAPPPTDAVEKATANIRNALELMQEAAPELSEETRALTFEIVLAVPASERRVFNGTSAFEFLGGILYNPHQMPTPIEAAINIVHEACHQLLFRLGHEELLILNPRSELHASPLREDPRPLEGIFHATVVIARMHYLLGKLLKLDRWGEEEREAISDDIAQYEKKFQDGVDVLDRHAQYGGDGAAIMACVKAYMQRAASAYAA